MAYLHCQYAPRACAVRFATVLITPLSLFGVERLAIHYRQVSVD